MAIMGCLLNKAGGAPARRGRSAWNMPRFIVLPRSGLRLSATGASGWSVITVKYRQSIVALPDARVDGAAARRKDAPDW